MREGGRLSGGRGIGGCCAPAAPPQVPPRPAAERPPEPVLEGLEVRRLLAAPPALLGTLAWADLAGSAMMAPALTQAPWPGGGAGPTSVRARAPAASPAPTSYPVNAAGLPLLHSLPGAPTAVFLDFDGDAGSGTTPYDLDGDPTTCNATEQANIVETWRQVSAYFAMFDTDVTTEAPAANMPKAWDAIGNNAGGATGGYAYVGTFPNSAPEAFNNSSNAPGRSTGITHEVGHIFGLQHQSTYDLLGNKIAEYAGPADDLHGILMGLDYAGSIHKWWLGHPANSPSALQDDLAVITGRIKHYEAAGGDGFRPDDFGNTLAAATPLPASSGGLAISGIIERLTDVDVFSFTSTGGPETLSAQPDAPSPVALQLAVENANGTLLAAASGPGNGEQITLALPAGSYYLLVSSQGNYGDVGGYNVSVAPASAGPVPPPATNALPAPTGLAVTGATSTSLTLNWADEAGESGFVVERSPDGGVFTPVGTTPAGVTTFTDPGLPSAQRYFYQVRASDPSGQSAASAVAAGSTRPTAASSFSVTSWTDTRLILNWRDVGGDAGYRIERSTDGATFTPVATVGANVPSYTDTGLTGGSVYYYRVVTLDGAGPGSSGDAAVSAVASNQTRLSAVTGLAFATVTPTQIALTWNAPAGTVGLTGYRVERSIDGANYSTLTTLAPGATGYTDPAVNPLGEYYYRITPTGTPVDGAAATPIFTATPAAPASALPAPWLAQDLGAVGGAGSGGSGASGYAGGAFTVVAGGSDIVGIDDSGRFTYQPLTGDGQITARVATLEPTDSAAKVGVMIRETAATNAREVAALATSATGLALTSRSATGGSTTSKPGPALTAPVWVRLVRSGNTFTAYYSTDGSAWTKLGSVVVTMNATVLIGLVSTAHTVNTLNTSTLDHVAVLLLSPPHVVGWQSVQVLAGGTEAALSVPADGSYDEARAAGVQRLLVSFDQAIAPGSFTPAAVRVAGNDAGGAALDLTGIAIATSTRNGDTVGEIDFTPALPDAARYLVRVQGVTNVAGVALAGSGDVGLAALRGDITGDQRVNLADLAAVATGLRDGSAAGDLTGDGVTDVLDLGLVSRNFGRSLAGVPAPVLPAGAPAATVAVVSATASGGSTLAETPSTSEPDRVDPVGLSAGRNTAVADHRLDDGLPTLCFGPRTARPERHAPALMPSGSAALTGSPALPAPSPPQDRAPTDILRLAPPMAWCDPPGALADPAVAVPAGRAWPHKKKPRDARPWAEM